MRIKVSFEMEVKDDVKQEDITEWLLFELGEQHQMKAGNQIRQDIEAENTSWYPADF